MSDVTFIKTGLNRNEGYINLAHVTRIDVFYPGIAMDGGMDPGRARLFMADGVEVRLSRE